MTHILENRRAPRRSTLQIAGLALVAMTALAPLDIANAQHGGGGGHGGGGAGGAHGGGGGGRSGGGGFHGGGGLRGDGGFRGGGYGGGGYGGYSDWDGGYYDAPPVVYGSPYYCSPALIYRHRGYYRGGC